MLIRCYGARGSVPVSGKSYLKYGGDTTCIEIRSQNDEIIIVDTGSGVRRLGNRLIHEKRFEYTILFTHCHWDHILGFPFFKPIYSDRTTLHIIGSPTVQRNLVQVLSKAMSPPYFPIPFDKLKAKINYRVALQTHFSIGSIDVYPISLSHPNSGLGYKFVEDGKSFVFLTDNELGYRHGGAMQPEEYVEFARDADLLIHDAEFTPEQYEMTRTWGHSTYVDALNLALAAHAKTFGLFHHNQDRDDADQDRILEDCREILSRKKAHMACFALTQDEEIRL